MKNELLKDIQNGYYFTDFIGSLNVSDKVNDISRLLRTVKTDYGERVVFSFSKDFSTNLYHITMVLSIIDDYFTDGSYQDIAAHHRQESGVSDTDGYTYSTCGEGYDLQEAYMDLTNKFLELITG